MPEKPEKQKKRMFNFSLGSSRPMFAIVTEDRSRYYNFVDTTVQWQPPSPLIERQRLAPLAEVQLRSSCKLLYDNVAKGEPAQTASRSQQRRPVERIAHRVSVQPELSPPLSLEQVKADFRRQSGENYTSPLENITYGSEEMQTEDTKSSLAPLTFLSTRDSTIDGQLMTPENGAAIHETIPEFDLGSPAEALEEFVAPSPFSLTQAPDSTVKTEQAEDVEQPQQPEKRKEAWIEQAAICETAELVAGPMSLLEMPMQAPPQPVPMNSPSETLGVRIDQFYPNDADNKRHSSSRRSSGSDRQTKSWLNLSTFAESQDVHMMESQTNQPGRQNDEEDSSSDSHNDADPAGNGVVGLDCSFVIDQSAGDNVVRPVTRAGDDGPSHSSSPLVRSPLPARTPSFSRPQTVSRTASKRVPRHRHVPSFENPADKMPETLRNSWQSGPSIETPESPSPAHEPGFVGLKVLNRPHPAGEAGSVAVIIDADGTERKMTESEERQRYLDLQRAVMEKMFTGAISAYTDEPNAAVSINEYISVKRSAPRMSVVSASTHERSKSNNNDAAKTAPLSKDEEHNEEANTLSPTMPGKKHGMLRKLSVLGGMNKRKSRNSSTNNNMVGISHIVEAS